MIVAAVIAMSACRGSGDYCNAYKSVAPPSGDCTWGGCVVYAQGPGTMTDEGECVPLHDDINPGWYKECIVVKTHTTLSLIHI